MRTIVCLLVWLSAVVTVPASGFSDYYEKARKSQAEGFYFDALEFYGKAGRGIFRPGQKILLLNNMAFCYKKTGDYAGAMACYERLDTLLKHVPARRNLCLLNKSDLLLYMGRYRTVVELLEPLKVARGEDVRVLNLSTAYARLGEYGRALELLDSVRMAHASAGDSVFVMATANKGYILWAMKRFTEAQECLRTALPLFRKADARYICQGNLALVEAENGQYDKAVAHIDACLDWQRTHIGASHPDYAISLRKKAEILLKMNRLKDAAQIFRMYFAKEKRAIIANFAYMTEQERLDYWNTKKELLAECYALEDTDPAFLYDVAVFSKSVYLLANLNIDRLAVKDKALARDYTFLKNLKYKIRESTGPERIALERKTEEKERAFMERVREVKAFAKSLDVDGRCVRRALRSNETAVELIRYTKSDTVRYAALLMTRDKGVTFVPLCTEEALESHPLKGEPLFGTVKEAVYSRKDVDKDRLYTDTLLGERLWRPILSHCPKGAAVYFSPEGLFHLFAIEYLNFGRPDCTLYRVSSTLRLGERRRGKVRPSFPVLVAGGLNYDDASAVRPEHDVNPDRSASELLGEEGLPPVEGGGYAFLEGSSAEVDSISRLLGKRADLVKGAAGTEEFFKKNLNRYRRVHLSTHGFCVDYRVVSGAGYMKDMETEDRSLSRCGLILSGANRASLRTADNRTIEDGILTARELCDLRLDRVDLMVLSACQTGLGRVTADGVAGLPRSLKKAGVNTLAVSLWEVNDRATQRMMDTFYRYLTRGMSVYRAFMRAQDDLRSLKTTETRSVSVFSGASLGHTTKTVSRMVDYGKPHFWAAFILIDGF